MMFTVEQLKSIGINEKTAYRWLKHGVPRSKHQKISQSLMMIENNILIASNELNIENKNLPQNFQLEALLKENEKIKNKIENLEEILKNVHQVISFGLSLKINIPTATIPESNISQNITNTVFENLLPSQFSKKEGGKGGGSLDNSTCLNKAVGKENIKNENSENAQEKNEKIKQLNTLYPDLIKMLKEMSYSDDWLLLLNDFLINKLELREKRNKKYTRFNKNKEYLPNLQYTFKNLIAYSQGDINLAKKIVANSKNRWSNIYPLNKK